MSELGVICDRNAEAVFLPREHEGGETMEIVIECPEGCSPGDTITIDTPNGDEVDVEIPEGVDPGDEFYIEVEVETEGGAQEEEEEEEEEEDEISTEVLRAAFPHAQCLALGREITPKAYGTLRTQYDAKQGLDLTQVCLRTHNEWTLVMCVLKTSIYGVIG